VTTQEWGIVLTVLVIVICSIGLVSAILDR
jgi:Na+-transporting methylmalonyl-CoA/oxaloacetate decarboxylase gamma subunit